MWLKCIVFSCRTWTCVPSLPGSRGDSPWILHLVPLVLLHAHHARSGQCSEYNLYSLWLINCVPQGTNLGPFLFQSLVFIVMLISINLFFADNIAALYIICHSRTITSIFCKFQKWCFALDGRSGMCDHRAHGWVPLFLQRLQARSRSLHFVRRHRLVLHRYFQCHTS